MFGSGDDHYDVELNKDALSMSWLKRTLNKRYEDGWSLKQLVAHQDNTILIFERTHR